MMIATLWRAPARRLHICPSMSPLRLVVLVPLLAITGCYSDAATQSTLPDPRYVSGPPGGLGASGDPAAAYEPPAGNPGYAAAEPPASPGAAAPSEDSSDDDEAGDDAAGRDGATGIEDADQDIAGSPGEPSDPGDPAAPAGELAEGPPAADAIAQADPTSRVTDTEIDVTLNGYGQWIDTDDYGQVWRPDATAVGVDFTPYESGGSWAYTDAGWAFASEYPWGWLPFHYGRWAWFHDYWGWVPSHRWGPAWVDWRHGGGVVGWRPTPPRGRDHRGDGSNVRDHRHGSGTLVRDHRSAQLHDAHWRFATTGDFGRPHVRSHLYGNLAEGLRVTSKVAAPPLRARTTIHAPELMRNRFHAAGAGGRIEAGPGRYAGPNVRDHRSSEPDRGYPSGRPGVQRDQPSQSYAPAGSPRSPERGYQGPPRGYQQPPRGYQQPPRGYQQPPRGYQQPPRGYQQPPRSFQPPRGGLSPVRGYPPPRSYRPPSPSSGPTRSWSPPSHTGSFGGSHGSGSSTSGSHSTGSSSSGSHSTGSSSSGSHSGGGRHR